ncbi:MAG: lipopolysaccharide kinase InaA family protein [Candidatus Binatia bacterium]
MAKVTIPSGFFEQRSGNTLWWLKVGWESRILPLFPPGDTGNPPIEENLPSVSITGGRGDIRCVPIGENDAIIIRRYRRGGFMRHFLHDLYWDRPLRPFTELYCTEEARRRGVPTVEVLAAQVEWASCGFYRGRLLTREATEFHNLWVWLQRAPSGESRRQTLAIVARTIARMHNAGIAHADLNPTNILVRPEGEPPQALVIDLDCARLFATPVPSYVREANLRRLQRFFNKYDVLGEWLSPTEWADFRRVYETIPPLKK